MSSWAGKGFDKFAPHNKHVPAPAAPATSETAQPSVPRILRSPSREAIQVSSTADSVVQTDSASGKPPVSGPSQNRPLLDLPRAMSRTEVEPRNDQGGAIVGYIVLPNHGSQVPRNINQPARQTDTEKRVEAQEVPGSTMMKTNGVLAPQQSRRTRYVQCTRMKTNDVLARQQEGVLPSDKQNTYYNGYLGVSNQASTTNTSTGAPPTGQAAASQNSHQQSPSEVGSKNSCWVM